MKIRLPTLFLAGLLPGLFQPIRAQDYPIRPVPFTQVAITDDFWRPRLETTTEVTIPYAFEQCESTGRIRNFAIAGGLEEGPFQTGRPYDDSDVFKIIEGAAYALSLRPNEKLDRYLDSLIHLIAAAQEDDGYLMTWRTIDPDKPPIEWAGAQRWSNLEFGHELYNVGHLYEAAVAHYQATGKRSLLAVAIKNADLIYRAFGPGKRVGYPGHQEIEIGLVKLYRATGEERYLELAELFLDRRGRKDWPEEGNAWETGEYWQDHVPVAKQTEAVGHAVRAGYMYAGMADVAAITGRQDYLEALEAIWDNVVSRKYYITGGVGASESGEAFGSNYHLPNAEAYNETCAAIAQDLWNYRMFLLQGKSKYIDVLERTLYNGVLPGQALDGRTFFYPNPLASNGQARSPWFGTACCPSNLTRFLPSLAGYIYAVQDDALFVNLFMSNEATMEVAGKRVEITQTTRYPWEGKIRLELSRTGTAPLEIRLRIPGWAAGRPVPSDLYHYVDQPAEKPYRFSIEGEHEGPRVEEGYLTFTLREKRHAIELEFPMIVRRIMASEKVNADKGLVAFEYGPIVYCAEWVDNDGSIDDFIVPPSANFTTTHRPDLLHGISILSGEVPGFFPTSDGRQIKSGSKRLTLIPYYAWAHRGEGPMKVWLPEKVQRVRVE